MAKMLKIVGVILVAVCFLLPMSSCTEYRDSAGNRVEVGPNGAVPPGAQKVTTQHHAWDWLRRDEPLSWLFVSSFFLPAILLLHAWFRPATRLTRALWFLEPLPLGGILYTIFSNTFFDTPEIGTYVAWVGVAFCFFGWAGEALYRLGRWRRRSIAA